MEEVVQLDKDILDALSEAKIPNPQVEFSFERLSTGSILIDFATGGGVPRGAFSTFWGEEGSWKTSMFLQMVGNMHRTDPLSIAALIDIERTFDPEYAKKFGVNLNRLLVFQFSTKKDKGNVIQVPMTAEDALNLMGKLISLEKLWLIGLDSVAAMSGSAQMQGEIGDKTYATVAALMTDFLSRWNGRLGLARIKAKKVNPDTGEIEEVDAPPPAIVFIQQMRDKIGTTGDPRTMNGGRALRHFSSLLIEMRKPLQKDTVLKGDEQLAVKVRGKVLRNKVGGAQYREYEVIFRTDTGFYGTDVAMELANLCTRVAIFQKSDGTPFENKGKPYFDGELIPLGNESAPEGSGLSALEYRLSQLFYRDGTWFDRVLERYLSNGVTPEEPANDQDDELDALLSGANDD